MKTISKKRHEKALITLKVDGELWHQVPGFDHSAADDNHYVVRIDDQGRAEIVFGDGVKGRVPPRGDRNIKVTYRYGRGNRYTSLLLQQGRLQLDDDMDEVNTDPGRLCGIYRGVVTNNSDPQSLMRLLVQVPAVLGNQEVWALACIPGEPSVVPAIGKGVWIMFENGAPANPVYLGVRPGVD